MVFTKNALSYANGKSAAPKNVVEMMNLVKLVRDLTVIQKNLFPDFNDIQAERLIEELVKYREEEIYEEENDLGD